jgi:hypothetical protein
LSWEKAVRDWTDLRAQLESNRLAALGPETSREALAELQQMREALAIRIFVAGWPTTPWSRLSADKRATYLQAASEEAAALAPSAPADEKKESAT